MQRYPFLTGPDNALNEECLGKARTSIVMRRATTHREILDSKFADDETLPETEKFARSFWRESWRSEEEVERCLDRLLWKMAAVPVAAREVLSVGCGAGDELVLLAGRCPGARITAIDEQLSLPREFEALPALRSYAGAIDKVLNDLEGSFDVIFSNHFLEHLYDPDAILRLLNKKLRVGGVLVSALPLDGSDDDAFHGILNEISATPSAVHPLDLIALDLGHPWKTDQHDLGHTLESAGFRDVSIFRRNGKPTCEFSGSLGELESMRKRAFGLNSIFRAVRASAKRLFPTRAPSLLARALFALEHRCWFGTNRLKNSQAYEVLVRAVST